MSRAPGAGCAPASPGWSPPRCPPPRPVPFPRPPRCLRLQHSCCPWRLCLCPGSFQPRGFARARRCWAAALPPSVRPSVRPLNPPFLESCGRLLAEPPRGPAPSCRVAPPWGSRCRGGRPGGRQGGLGRYGWGSAPWHCLCKVCRFSLWVFCCCSFFFCCFCCYCRFFFVFLNKCTKEKRSPPVPQPGTRSRRGRDPIPVGQRGPHPGRPPPVRGEGSVRRVLGGGQGAAVPAASAGSRAPRSALWHFVNSAASAAAPLPAPPGTHWHWLPRLGVVVVVWGGGTVPAAGASAGPVPKRAWEHRRCDGRRVFLARCSVPHGQRKRLILTLGRRGLGWCQRRPAPKAVTACLGGRWRGAAPEPATRRRRPASSPWPTAPRGVPSPSLGGRSGGEPFLLRPHLVHVASLPVKH